jgi:hypothetical protein
MSFRDATTPQDLGPDRLKPGQGTPNLHASVEAAGPAIDLCTGPAPRDVVRERLLVWLAEGSREVTWALCSLPRERWAAPPPVRIGDWTALRHVRHLALNQSQQLLPAVRRALGESADEAPIMTTVELDQADAAWDAATAVESAEAIVRDLGQARFELLQCLESAPDDVWQRPLDTSVATALHQDPPVELDRVLLSARQQELHHLAAIWRLALNWGRVSRERELDLEKGRSPGVPLHPADRLEESH